MSTMTKAESLRIKMKELDLDYPLTEDTQGAGNDANTTTIIRQNAPDEEAARHTMIGSLSDRHTIIGSLSDKIKSIVQEIILPEDQQQEYESPIPEDIFSLIYLCDSWSQAFFFSFLVFLVQMGIILLILFDLIDWFSTDNPLRIPPGVPLEVTIAQGVAMMLGAATQTNLLAALSRIALGPTYDHESVKSIYPGATKKTYQFSFVLQFIAGFSMLLDGFILNMQSTTVLSLMLNFAALAFISEIQEVAFWVAKNGYISPKIQEATLQVVSFEIPKQQRCQHSIVGKRVCFYSIILCLWVFYAIIVSQQRTGDFLCSNLQVQFGDGFRPDLAFFSGIYQKTNYRISDRATYEDARKTTRFAYCAKEQAWTFSGPTRDIKFVEQVDGNISVPKVNNDDPCSYWLKSRPTVTYDITETMSQSWLVNEYITNQALPIDHLFLECNDCQGARATHSCSGHGTCRNNQCECDDGRTGDKCGFPAPCPTLELDLRTEPFSYAAGAKFTPANSYELLLNNKSEPVLAYGKPIYIDMDAERETSDGRIPMNVLMFTGRRYGLFLNFEFSDASKFEQSLQGFPTYAPDFHTWFSKHRIYFFSEPMDLGTQSDWSSPMNLQWYRSRKLISLGDKSLYRVDTKQPSNTALMCPICQFAFNECFNEGNCTLDDNSTGRTLDGNLFDLLDQQGVCECPYGFSGHLCEKELDCSGTACLHGGNCTEDGACSCTSRYTGKLCQYEIHDWTIS